MADRDIQNIGPNWFALSEDDQDARVQEWMARNNIPAIAEDLLNRMYEDVEIDASDDSGNDDADNADADSDDGDNSGDGDNADDNSDDGDNDSNFDDTSDEDSVEEDNADDDFVEDDNADDDAVSDTTLQVEEEPFDFFKFDYSYDRHNGPPYEDEEFIYSDVYAEMFMAHEALDEPDYEDVIDR